MKKSLETKCSKQILTMILNLFFPFVSRPVSNYRLILTCILILVLVVIEQSDDSFIIFFETEYVNPYRHQEVLSSSGSIGFL